MLQEFIIAARTLLKRPGYALSVIVTLTLGIGASTMMFSLVDAALLRPLPFAHPDRLVMLTGVVGPERSPRGGSVPEITDWRAMNETLDAVAIYDAISLNMRVGTEAIRVPTEMVSAGYFSMLGASAAVGRTFLPEEDAVLDGRPVAIVSRKLWRDRLGGDADIIGRTVLLNDRPFSIVGVMPEGFAGVSFNADLWVPSMMVTLTTTPTAIENRDNRWLLALGHLKPEMTVARAQEDLTRVGSILERRYPDTNRERGVQVTPLDEALVGSTGTLVISLFIAVLLFLVVACANVASLQLARATTRRRELAVRLALGARRWHVVRQLLAESFELSAVAGTFGAIAAAWSLGIVVALMPAGALPPHVHPTIDMRALVFTLGAALTAGALVAILPARTAVRRDLAHAIKQGARAAGPGLGSIRRPSTQQGLVVVEIALAGTLLTAAGLMVRSLERQMQVTLGFDPRGLTVAQLTLPASRYAPAERAVFVERLAERLGALPRVTSASVSSTLPFTGASNAARLFPDGGSDPNAGIRYFRHMVTPRFFSTLGIPVLSGRAFADSDRPGAPPVAIINADAARRIWGDRNAVGRRFRLGTADGPVVEVIGIAATARFRDLTSDLAGARSEPDVYFPFAQRTDRDLEIAVRSADGSTIDLALLQEAVSGLDAGLPLYRVQRLESAIAAQTSSVRFGSALLMVFSGGALLLAAVGLYGLVAYVLSLSRREIAIRLALGADARRVTSLIVRHAMVLVGAGMIAGACGAFAAGRALQTQLFQTPAADPATYGWVGLVLLAVTFAASLLPTRRAVRIDPQAALRAE